MLKLKHLSKLIPIKNSTKMFVFNMAGTTVNDKGIVYDTIYDTLKMLKYDVYKDDMWSWHGKSKNDVLINYVNKKYNISNTYQKSYQKNNDILKQELVWTFKRNLKNNYFNQKNICIMHDCMPDLFNIIRERGVKIGITSGYDKEIQQAIIGTLKMDTFIDDYVSCDDVINGKPYPDMIRLLMKRNEITNPNEVIKFGDTKNDILEGINAKCYLSVGVLSGAGDENELSRADYILNSVMDIRL